MKINLNEVRQFIRKEIVLNLVKEAAENYYLTEQSDIRAEKNEEFVLRYQAGDTSVLDKFIKYNTPLVYKLATKYYRPNSGFEMDDLMQAGYMGLMKAAEIYDPSKENANIGSTLYYWVRASMTKELDVYGSPVTFKGKHARDIRKIKHSLPKIEKDLRNQLGRDPSFEELSDKSGISPEVISNIRSVRGVGIDSPVGGDDDSSMTLGDTIAYSGISSPEDFMLKKEFEKRFDEFVDRLTNLTDIYALRVITGEMTNQEAADRISEEEGRPYSKQALNLRVNRVRDMLKSALGDYSYQNIHKLYKANTM